MRFPSIPPRTLPVFAAVAGMFLSMGAATHAADVAEEWQAMGMGQNWEGGLGVPEYPKLSIPSGIVSFSEGHWTTLFIKADGTLWGMGDTGSGKLGNGHSGGSTHVPFLIASEVASASAGSNQSLFLGQDGALWGMGYNFYGQLGTGDTTDRLRPVKIADGVVGMSSASHSAFIRTDGSLWTVGRNDTGQLGNGGTADTKIPAQVAEQVKQVSCGALHTLFVKEDGSLWGMGCNTDGQLGRPASHSEILPVAIASGVVHAEAGSYNSFFIRTDGTLWAMGRNDVDQLGVDNSAAPHLPVQVAADVLSVSPGRDHTLFVKTDGSLWAMGYNKDRQLGDGTATRRSIPVQVASGVAAAGAGTKCGMYLKTDGSLWGMGRSWASQLGYPENYDYLRPVAVMDDVARVSSGESHSLWLMKDGRLLGAGTNGSRQLDATAPYSESFLLPITIATGVIDAWAGYRQTVYVKADGTLWGLGDAFGTGTGPFLLATDVRRAVTYGSTLFLKNDATLWLLEGGPSSQVATDVADFAAGMNSFYYVRTDGTLWGWGDNQSGQLGDVSRNDYHTVPVPISSDVSCIAAGASHLLYVKRDGSLWAQGAASYGQLGTGPPGAGVFSLTPATQVAEGVGSVSAGRWTSLFVKTDGTLWGMGDNLGGQLGDGTMENRFYPVKIANAVRQASSGHYQSLFIRNPRLTPAGKFASWMKGTSLGGDDLSPTAAPFGDDIPNLLKYAFNLRNDAPDVRRMDQGDGTVGLPHTGLAQGPDGAVFRIEFLRRKDVELIYTPEMSSELKNDSFGGLWPSPEISVTTVDSIWEKVRYDVPWELEWSPTLFGRVKVTLPEN